MPIPEDMREAVARVRNAANAVGPDNFEVCADWRRLGLPSICPGCDLLESIHRQLFERPMTTEEKIQVIRRRLADTGETE